MPERFLVISPRDRTTPSWLLRPAGMRNVFPESDSFRRLFNRRDLVLRNPHLDRIFAYRNNIFSVFSFICNARCRYDVVLVFHANDDILKFLPRLRFGACYNRQESRTPTQDFFPESAGEAQHQEAFGDGGADQRISFEDYRYEFRLKEGMARWADAKLREWDWLPGTCWSDCNRAAGAFRRWPTESLRRCQTPSAKHQAKIFVNASVEEAELVRISQKTWGIRASFSSAHQISRQRRSSVLARFYNPDTGRCMWPSV